MFKKAILLSLVIVFLFSSVTLAFENVTGNEWQEFSEEEKEIYAEGWLDGLNFGVILIVADLEPKGIDIDLIAEHLKRDGTLLIEETNKGIKEDLINTLNEMLEGERTVFSLFVEDQLDI